MKPQQKPVLPELRQDLRLEKGAADTGGQPTWLIVDMAQHRYIQIGDTARLLLTCWEAGKSFDDLKTRVADEQGVHVSEDDITGFIKFLATNNLTVEPVGGSWKGLAERPAAARRGWLSWLLHNYLFIRIPLLRPEPMLRRLLPFAAPLFTRAFFVAVAIIGVVGFYLVSRQWESFFGTFSYLFTVEGIILSMLSLIIVKSAHELGHALVAARFGCAVPSMGICFLVLFPVLYTDVTDAWRLKDRRQRFLIGAAGIIVELCFAALATFAWAFLPEGILKSLAFSIATVGWIMSLAINLNPLMRFDGYYLFSDILGIDNLQSRSFAFGQWRLREALFGFGDKPPEIVSTSMRRTLIGFAWAVWIYRVILFTGIALLVYHMTFKVLGLILFAAEIGYFIIRPIYNELVHWWQRRADIVRQPRSRVSSLITAGVVVILLVPWSTKISVPAVVESSNLTYVFPQREGDVAKVHVKVGDRVAVGDPLVTLKSDALRHKEAIAKRKRATIRSRLARRGVDGVDLSSSLVLEQQLKALNAEITGLAREISELEIRAPHDGIVVELNGHVHPDRAINQHEVVALVRSASPLVARGYIVEHDVSRVRKSAGGVFVPDTAAIPSFPVSLSRISLSATQQVEISELASVYGGPVAVRPNPTGRGSVTLSPVEAVFAASMSVENPPMGLNQALRGTVVLNGEARSILERAVMQVASVLVRESGF